MDISKTVNAGNIGDDHTDPFEEKQFIYTEYPNINEPIYQPFTEAKF